MLTATHLGEVGTVGSVDVDVQTGEFDNSAQCKENILQAASAVVDKLPSYVRHEAIPDKNIAHNLQPTIMRPQGKPREIIATTHCTDF